MRERRVEYGLGGFDPAKPNDNVVLDDDFEVSAEFVNAASLRTKIEAALGLLEQADENWDTLNAAQRAAAMRLAVRVSAKLVRLTLGRLEAE